VHASFKLSRRCTDATERAGCADETKCFRLSA
jgi:hypothetical protein